MAIRFILGRSGTGKTRYCVDGIVNALLDTTDSSTLILLVPEQATYQAQRAVLADGRIAGYSRLCVLSFDRLQFLLLGGNTARPTLSRIGRTMVVQALLRKNKDKLTVLNASADLPGLGCEVAELLAELHRYNNGPEDIDSLLKDLPHAGPGNLTTEKFRDIKLIHEQYLAFIKDRRLDPDIQLAAACRRVAAADWLKHTKLWVDGFSDFTAAEIAMLLELLKTADRAHIALCLDPSRFDLSGPDPSAVNPADLFSPTQQTYAELIEQIRKSRLKLGKPVILKHAARFNRAEELAHVEKHVLDSDVHKAKSAGAVKIVSAADARAEVQFVAREILKLVRRCNLRYRDIAVVAPSIEQYDRFIEAYFADYGIPVFIDRRRALSRHPLIELVCSALQVVIGRFNSSDVFAYLKTDLVPVSRCEVDALENYCLAFGITGDDWMREKPWDYAGPNGKFDEQRINKTRLAVAAPLLKLRDELLGRDSAGDGIFPEQFVLAVFNFFETIGVRRTLAEWINRANEQKGYSFAEEHRQLYEKIVDLFDELCCAFEGQKLSCADYLAVLTCAFSQTTLAFIPPTLDQVLVGSIERSRHPDLKAVFLTGATQKQFPAPLAADGLLTDSDRRAALAAGFNLAPGRTAELAKRQYLAYIAFTRASDLLYVTYPAIDDKASAVARSQFVDNLQSLFEDLQEHSITDGALAPDSVYTSCELEDILCSRGEKDSQSPQPDKTEIADLLDAVCSDDQLTELGARVTSALSYDNSAKLDTEIVKQIFGSRIRSSATRLSTFAQCPYRYFAHYVLSLERRAEFRLEPLNLGDFYHKVLDSVFKRLKREGVDLLSERSRLPAILDEQIQATIESEPFISSFVAHRAHNSFIVRCAAEYLQRCVLAVVEMVGAGSFRPAYSEIAFGRIDSQPGLLGQLRLGISDGRALLLDGKIDRLDVAEIDGKRIALVFDYKRSGQAFNWSKFYYGLDIQLPVYLLAVRDAKDAKGMADDVAGAFFVPIEARPRTVEAGELERAAGKFTHKANGVFNGLFAAQLDGGASGRSGYYNFSVLKKDGSPFGHYGSSGALRPEHFDTVLDYAQGKIIELAERILSGDIEVRPYQLGTASPCSFCDYKPVCRFDWQINDYNSLSSLPKGEVLKEIGARDA